MASSSLSIANKYITLLEALLIGKVTDEGHFLGALIVGLIDGDATFPIGPLFWAHVLTGGGPGC